MGWLLLGSLGALFGGLFLAAKDLFPYLAATRSGVIARKRAGNIRVRRDEDSETFARLLAIRAKGAAVGLAVSMAGAFVLGLFGLAISGFSGPLAILILVISVGFGLFAAFCLIRGFATGRMFAIWSLSLFGEATLKQNPLWFWVYAIANVFVVLIVGSMALQTLAR
jgi:hypothetical protein